MESTTSDSSTDAFYAHAAATIDRIDPALVPDDVSFTLEQQITDGDQLVGHYHFTIADGTVAVIHGAAQAADVTLRQDATTARSLQDGTIHAQGAFLTGRLSIDGDINTLLENGPLLSRLLDSMASGS